MNITSDTCNIILDTCNFTSDKNDTPQLHVISPHINTLP